MASRKLSNYRAKRDFTRTAEPSGAVDVAPAEHLRFVIQKHDATRLHYDLRLELGGVFKSWAVTRGPSLDPAEKRLAVEVEDHPLAYGDFEGTIPGGEYGGGTVQLWDRGFWAPEDGRTPEAALASGDLKFVLEGERLHGSWVLVRMKSDRFGGKHTNWLLIKHRDAYARPGDRDALLAEDRSVASGRPMAQIAAGKGRAPQPFMLAQGQGAADAVWHSNRGEFDRGAGVTAQRRGASRGDDVGPGGRGPSNARHAVAAGTGDAELRGGDGSAEPGTGRREGGAPGEPSARSRRAGAPLAASSAGGSLRERSGRVGAGSAAGRRDAAVRGASMPAFIEPQQALLVERPPSAAGWGHEIKLDGYRLQLRVEKGCAVLKTRTGLDWTDKFAAIAAAARHLPDCILDGEAVVLNSNQVPDFSALQAALAEGRSESLEFCVFDMLFADDEDLRARPLRERKQRLQEMLDTQPREVTDCIRYLGHIEAPGDSILESARKASYEGIVSKQLDAPYRSGRTGSWMKTKLRTGQEVVIGGWTAEGQELRALIAGVYRDGRFVHVGRVGTGFNSDNMGSLVTRLKQVATDKSPFNEKVPVPSDRRVHWVKPELVAEIEFAGWTEGGNVREAAFKGLRDDKPAKEIRAEMPVAASEAAPGDDSGSEGDMTPAKQRVGGGGAQSRRAGAGEDTRKGADDQGEPRASRAVTPSAPNVGRAGATENNVMGVTVSNPDKVFWPDAGDDRPVTKLDLVRYFEAVGDWLLPHVEGRPCSIVRAPDGIQGETFFQRHAMSGLSKLFDLVRVSGDHKPYVVINRVEALAAVGQSGGVELHPWNCEPHHPDVPGRLVFDLDPAPDVGFNTVIEAALEMRARLAVIGLESFCKTTGGKGLHVVTPLAHPEEAHLDWEFVKAFAREICRQMAADHPDKYLINMSKSARKGLIFLDYLRNDRLSTAVAPLSPRIRAGAPVSMPVTWDQVRAGLDPARFTIRTAPGLIARSKAWQGYEEAARPIVRAVELLSQSAKPGARGVRAAAAESSDAAPAKRGADARRRAAKSGAQGSKSGKPAARGTGSAKAKSTRAKPAEEATQSVQAKRARGAAKSTRAKPATRAAKSAKANSPGAKAPQGAKKGKAAAKGAGSQSDRF